MMTAVIAIAITHMDDSANFSDRRPCGMDVHIGEPATHRLNDLLKIYARSNALAVRTNHIGYCNRAADGAGSGIGAGRDSRVSGGGWAVCGLAQKHHDATGLLGKTKMNVRLGNLSIQVVVGYGVAEGCAIRAESGLKRASSLGGNRTRGF